MKVIINKLIVKSDCDSDYFTEEIMTLKEQQEQLKISLANQSVAVKAEFDQVKAILDAKDIAFEDLKGNFDLLKAELDKIKDQIEGVDFTDAIKSVDDSIAEIDKISTAGDPPADTTPPAIPTGLAASNITDVGVDLAWDADADAAVFSVFQDGAKLTDVAENTYSVSGLSSATGYVFSVSATDAAGNESSQSDAVNVTTL